MGQVCGTIYKANAMQKKIVIIDDDAKMNRQLGEYLKQFAMDVVSFVAPLDALKQLEHEKPDCIILDIMLPQMDGFAVCKEIRKTINTPVLMLTARGDVTDRIVGLEIGADDYLPKPFEPRELVARIQALIRRSSAPVQRNDIRQFDNLIINTANRSCLLDGLDCKLTAMEFEILHFFIERPNRAIDRDTLMEHLKGMDCQAFDRSIDIAISRLRQKIGDDSKHPRYFKTIRGTGYVFIAQELTP